MVAALGLRPAGQAAAVTPTMRQLAQAGKSASAATTCGSVSAVASAAWKTSVGMVSNRGHHPVVIPAACAPWIS